MLRTGMAGNLLHISGENFDNILKVKGPTFDSKCIMWQFFSFTSQSFNFPFIY